MTKILNFALKIKGGGREGGTCEVLRPCHPPQNLKRAPLLQLRIPKFTGQGYKKGTNCPQSYSFVYAYKIVVII